MDDEQWVYGLVVEQGGSRETESESESQGNDHTHEIFLITWDGRLLHTHGFSGITSVDVGHRHAYSALTRPAPSGVPHTHAYETVTTLNDGHRHRISGRTGPAIPLPGGGHIHYFRGVTTVDGRVPHRHTYSGRTGKEQ
ncbi:YmaF family protein [Alicyclobacillus dauci]|uniref:YmaF family protein n=1 Tax=Alicyclobacillus dauci TaxID=1475485 RepID=A0ABY6Z318_9BACL|nr:YmaF family protein [Alicyclobacillus dauci]WAH36726.1 YmaF family protein [Alicyclobacillus dauci]